jgi:hypothetical protein
MGVAGESTEGMEVGKLVEVRSMVEEGLGGMALGCGGNRVGSVAVAAVEGVGGG